MADLEIRIMTFLLHFLEEADADTVDSDATVDVFESVADWVQRAPADEQAAFLARLERFAEDDEEDPRLAGFARALPPMLGLE